MIFYPTQQDSGIHDKKYTSIFPRFSFIVLASQTNQHHLHLTCSRYVLVLLACTPKTIFNKHTYSNSTHPLYVDIGIPSLKSFYEAVLGPNLWGF